MLYIKFLVEHGNFSQTMINRDILYSHRQQIGTFSNTNLDKKQNLVSEYKDILEQGSTSINIH